MTQFLSRVERLELSIVERSARVTRNRAGRALAIAVSRLGNGSLYVILVLVFYAVAGRAASPVILSAVASIALGQGVQFLLKRRYRRLRPYERSASITPLLATRDPHSFPSGHMMTLTAAMVPALIHNPVLAWFAAPLWVLMVWSRMACGHHFPSDVLAGTLLGLAAAWPVTLIARAMGWL